MAKSGKDDKEKLVFPSERNPRYGADEELDRTVIERLNEEVLGHMQRADRVLTGMKEDLDQKEQRKRQLLDELIEIRDSIHTRISQYESTTPGEFSVKDKPFHEVAMTLYQREKQEELDKQRWNREFSNKKYMQAMWDNRITAWIVHIVICGVIIAAIVNLSLAKPGERTEIWFGLLGTALGMLIPRPKFRDKSAKKAAEVEDRVANIEGMSAQVKMASEHLHQKTKEMNDQLTESKKKLDTLHEKAAKDEQSLVFSQGQVKGGQSAKATYILPSNPADAALPPASRDPLPIEKSDDPNFFSDTKPTR